MLEVGLGHCIPTVSSESQVEMSVDSWIYNSEFRSQTKSADVKMVAVGL